MPSVGHVPWKCLLDEVSLSSTAVDRPVGTAEWTAMLEELGPCRLHSQVQAEAEVQDWQFPQVQELGRAVLGKVQASWSPRGVKTGSKGWPHTSRGFAKRERAYFTEEDTEAWRG